MKKLLLTITSLFLIWQSWKLLKNIEVYSDSSTLGFIVLAIIINIFITGIFAFAGFAFPTQKLLSKGYYRINRPKYLKRVYKVIRVEIFRKGLLVTFWKDRKRQKFYFNGARSGFNNLILQSKKSEFGHLIPLILITLLCIYFIALGIIELAIYCTIINIIFNLYPIVLQRHHRMRIQLIKQRYNHTTS